MQEEIRIEIKSDHLQECRNKFRIEEFKLLMKNVKFTKSYPKSKKIRGYYVGGLKASNELDTHKVYRDSEGNPLPSVTTILKKATPVEDFLLEWANNLGIRRIKYKEYMKDITETGQCVHEIVEKYTSERMSYIDTEMIEDIFRDNPYYYDNIDTVHRCFSQFMEWFNTLETFEIVANEESLISEEYKFGGTIDMICKIDGKFTILDLKTSNALDSKMVMQLAAYVLLYEENYPHIAIDQVAILRMDKKDTECREYMVIPREDMDEFIEYFKEMLKFVECVKTLNSKFYEFLGDKVYYKR